MNSKLPDMFPKRTPEDYFKMGEEAGKSFFGAFSTPNYQMRPTTLDEFEADMLALIPYAVSFLYKSQVKIFKDVDSIQTWAEGKGVDPKGLELVGHYVNKPHEREFHL